MAKNKEMMQMGVQDGRQVLVTGHQKLGGCQVLESAKVLCR